MLEGVVKTALGVALVRAHESRREDRLFEDPLAQAFLDEAPGMFPEPQADRPASAPRAGSPGARGSLGAVFAFHAALRTRFFDDYLLAAAQEGCRQVVLLAAGLDTRAFRLAWPQGVSVFELDLPELFAFKEPVLARHNAVPRCQRIVVPADLREDWPRALADAGFDPSAATAWLAEGLLIYLTPDEAARLLTGVGELSAPGSRLAFEHGSIASPALLAETRGLPSMAPYAALWKGGLGEDAQEWLSERGWAPRIHDGGELAVSYGRAAPRDSSGGFLTAVRG